MSKTEAIWSVDALCAAISGTLMRTFGSIAVKGEVTNFKISSKGHAYFSIKEGNSIINAVCFKGYYQKCNINIENGMSLVLYGEIQCYESRSEYQINVRNIKFDGIGEMMRIFEERKQRLIKQGIFDETHKKPIPKIPKKIGLITSLGGAVVHDIIVRLEERLPIELLIYDIPVQGQDVPLKTLEAIEYFEQYRSVDAIIIARGGGSMEDLFYFNDEALVMGIYNAKTPIISAIGHEIDYTLCDFVSDLRAPTPTAAAEIAVPTKQNIIHECGTIGNKIANILLDKLTIAEMMIDNLFEPAKQFLIKVETITHSLELAKNNMKRHLAHISQALLYKQQILRNMSGSINALLYNKLSRTNTTLVFTKVAIARKVEGTLIQIQSKLLAIPISHKALQQKIQLNINKIFSKIESNIKYKVRFLDHITFRLASVNQDSFNKLQIKVNTLEANVKDYSKSSNKTILNTINDLGNKISYAGKSISLHNYHIILEKGYSIIRDAKFGSIITNIRALKSQICVKIQMQDGTQTFMIQINKKTLGELFITAILLLAFFNFAF